MLEVAYLIFCLGLGLFILIGVAFTDMIMDDYEHGKLLLGSLLLFYIGIGVWHCALIMYNIEEGKAPLWGLTATIEESSSQ